MLTSSDVIVKSGKTSRRARTTSRWWIGGMGTGVARRRRLGAGGVGKRPDHHQSARDDEDCAGGEDRVDGPEPYSRDYWVHAAQDGDGQEGGYGDRGGL